MKTNWLTIVLVFGILILGFLQFQACNKTETPTALTDSIKTQLAVIDSLKKSAVAVSFDNEQTKLKYGADTIAYRHKIDSQSHIIAVLQGKFKVTKDSIGSLYANLKIFYLNHDTVSLAETYQNLATQLNDANNQLFAIQIARDSSDNIRDKEIQSAHEVIDDLQNQIVRLQSLLQACTVNADALGKTATKAAKKAKMAALLGKVGLGIAAILTAFLLLEK